MIFDRELLAGALPGYDVGDELGRGGWGVVLAATHRQLGRQVAVKQLPRAFAADPSVRRRFLEEARTVAKLDHPHIVPIYDFVDHEGVCLIVMEQMQAGTLWDRFVQKGIQLPQACAVMLVACSALEHAHGHGVIHRDVKPENFLFSQSGVLKLSDFGIAKVLDQASTALTVAGQVVGTPAYMAPEQALGGDLTPAVDIYACGVMLYELLTGQLPFPDSEEPLQQLTAKLRNPPVPIESLRPDMPQQVGDAVMRALAREPGDRYPTAHEFGLTLAAATTAALDTGWLRGSGVDVHGAADVVAVTERATVSARITPIAGQVVRATSLHARIGTGLNDIVPPPPAGVLPPQIPPPPAGVLAPTQIPPPPAGVPVPAQIPPPPAGVPVPTQIPPPPPTPPSPLTPPPPTGSRAEELIKQMEAGLVPESDGTVRVDFLPPSPSASPPSSPVPSAPHPPPLPLPPLPSPAPPSPPSLASPSPPSRPPAPAPSPAAPPAPSPAAPPAPSPPSRPPAPSPAAPPAPSPAPSPAPPSAPPAPPSAPPAPPSASPAPPSASPAPPSASPAPPSAPPAPPSASPAPPSAPPASPAPPAPPSAPPAPSPSAPPAPSPSAPPAPSPAPSPAPPAPPAPSPAPSPAAPPAFVAPAPVLAVPVPPPVPEYDRLGNMPAPVPAPTRAIPVLLVALVVIAVAVLAVLIGLLVMRSG